MAYVIKRTSPGGGFVSKNGCKSAYTNNLYYIRKYETIQKAERNRCTENEVIINLEDLLDMLRK